MRSTPAGRVTAWIVCAALLLFTSSAVRAQDNGVSVSRAHSHNDYFRSVPFYTAYSCGFGSIEPDVMLVDGVLLVCHDKRGIDTNRTLQRLYIDPIVRLMALNGGKAYPDGRPLQLFIDLKTDYRQSIPALLRLIEPVRECFDRRLNPAAVRIVLSGGIPSPEHFADYDAILSFDGHRHLRYTPGQLERVALFNDPFFAFSKWNGKEKMAEKEFAALKHYVDSIHTIGKPVRFWATPESETTFRTFINLGVDYLNTDHPEKLAVFLNNYN